MATVYLNSQLGDDNNDGTNPNTPVATFNAAATQAGDFGTVWVHQDHDETFSSDLFLSTAKGQKIAAVSDFASLTPVDVFSAQYPKIRASNESCIYHDPGSDTLIAGIEFSSYQATGANRPSHYFAYNDIFGHFVYQGCRFINQAPGNAKSMAISRFRGKAKQFIFRHCAFRFSRVSQKIEVFYGRPVFDDCVVEGVIPTQLIKVLYSGGFVWKNSDLSNVDTNLVWGQGNGDMGGQFIRCRLHPNVNLVWGNRYGSQENIVRLYECGDAPNNYDHRVSAWQGEINTDTGIYRQGGAGANSGLYSGATEIPGLSWRMAANANVSYPARTLESDDIARWHDGPPGSPVTVAVDIASAAVLTDADCWMELEYPADATSPKGETVTSRAPLNAAPAALSASAATWANGPANRYQLTLTVTPRQRGFLRARVYLAAAVTVFVDPMLQVS